MSKNKHYVVCRECMKKNVCGACSMRFWDDKDGLILPKLCPYGLKSVKWTEYTPRASAQGRFQFVKYTDADPEYLVRNAAPKKEIRESWATRN